MTQSRYFLAASVAIAVGLAVIPSANAAGLSGAIFTTVADGSVVNANRQYQSKCDVYLDGGPGPNAPAKAAGLPDGSILFPGNRSEWPETAEHGCSE